MFVQMYLEPNDTERIKEIFSRLNKNSYNLNKIEKQSSQLVEYDYMTISKIATGMISSEDLTSYVSEIDELFASDEEDGVEVSIDEVKETISPKVLEVVRPENVSNIIELFTSDRVFTEYERQRQVSLQYFLNIFTCIVKDEFINRNAKESEIIELSKIEDYSIQSHLEKYNNICGNIITIYDSGKLDSFWKTKTSFFTLSVVFSKLDNTILDNLESIMKVLVEFKNSDTSKWKEYNECSTKDANGKTNREKRSQILERTLVDKLN